MVVVFFSLLQFYLIVRATLVSRREKFSFGVAAGALRTVLALSNATVAVLLRIHQVSNQTAAEPSGLASAAFIGMVLGPIVSSTTLWFAYQRTKNLAASQEEAASRPFGAWLPVVLIDAVFIGLQVFIWWLMRID
jgi:hypothetical protein